MMLIEQTSVAANDLPIAQFRDHLRLGTGFADDALQDEVLESCLRSAISVIEGRTGKVLIEKRFQLSVTAWRAHDWHSLPVAPVLDVASVSIIDRAGTATLVAPESYVLRKDNAVPKIISNGHLPIVPAGGAAEVVFTAGFGADWTAVPDDLLRAVYVLAAQMYERRSGAEEDLPPAVEMLIERYRPVRISGGGV